MNILYCTLVLAISSLYNIHAADVAPPKANPMVSALQGIIGYFKSSHPTDTYIRLEEYNMHPYYTNVSAIKDFLDEQLSRHCLNPERFHYFVGTADQDWQIIKLDDVNFGLIIPDPSSSISALGTQLNNLFAVHKGNSITSVEPTYALNVKQLSDLLNQRPSNSQKHKLAKYKLAIVKAFVQAEDKKIFDNVINACYAGVSSLVIGNAPSDLLAYTLSGLSAVYSYIKGQDDWVNFQKNLDEYILGFNDIELIQAHIEDLEDQVAQNQSSYTARFMAHLPMIAHDPLKERLLLFKNYYKELITEFMARNSQNQAIF